MFFKKIFLFILLQSFLFSFVLGIDIVFQRRTYRFRSWASCSYLRFHLLALSFVRISSKIPFLSMYSSFHIWHIVWSTQHVITTAVTFSIRLSRRFKRQRQRAFRIPNALSTVTRALDNFLLNCLLCHVSDEPYWKGVRSQGSKG